MPGNEKSGISRRDLLRITVAGAGAAALAWVPGQPAKADSGNPTITENSRTGTSAWQLTNPATNREIEGYASLTSVNRGGTIQLFVNTASPTYTLKVFRMGWYGGQGGRMVFGPVTLNRTAQPMPTPDPVTGMIECNWTNPYTLTINNPADPTDWCSGVYLVQLTASGGKQSYIIFTVRDDSRASDFLLNSCVTTYQAYNTWGGKCLYSYLSPSGKSNKVSFNRPYGLNKMTPALAFGVGAAEFLLGSDGGPPGGWEYCMVRFLERNGYDVSYCTSVDVHENPGLLLAHQGFLVAGHDEYWSQEMRNNIASAINQGVNAAFMSANVCYWQIRMEASPLTGAADRTIVCYKGNPSDTVSSGTLDPFYSDTDPTNDNLITVRWRDSLPNSSRVGRPEESLLGTMYAFGADNVNNDLVVEDASNWVFAGTGVINSVHLPGLLGYESDEMQGSSPPGTVRLCRSFYTGNSATGTGFSDMTLYTAPSGATVFATGSVQWAWGLDNWGVSGAYPYYGSGRLSVVNITAQQMTANILAHFRVSPPPNPNNQPMAQIGGPYNGIANFQVQFDGSASYAPAGIANYVWDFGDGAMGSGMLPTHAYAQPGTYNVILTITDGIGQTNSSATTVTVSALGQMLNIFPPVVTPASAYDPNPIELGARFVSDVNGYILGVRFYKSPSDRGTHVGSLWSSGGQLLAGVSFTNETASGWQQALFNTPVAITAGTVYVTSYHTTAGNYAGDSLYFAGEGADNPPLHALQDGVSGGNGLYLYGGGGFPTNSYRSSNYWADVVFTPATTSPPTLSSIAISPGSVSGGSPATGTVTLSGPALGNGAVVALSSDNAAASVPANVTVLAGAASASFAITTTTVLTNTTANITGSYNGASASAPLTITPAPTTTSIWSNPTPTRPSVADASAVEVGVKFKSSASGFIRGIRFYKSAKNTGTHVGSLWDNSGHLLGQATFVNETASGWQQVLFTNPVAITAGVVYVASYHTAVGFYSGDNNYFANSGAGNPPLQALQNGVSGGNGIYLYGSGGFPTNSYLSTNYWVDVVFSTS